MRPLLPAPTVPQADGLRALRVFRPQTGNLLHLAETHPVEPAIVELYSVGRQLCGAKRLADRSPTVLSGSPAGSAKLIVEETQKEPKAPSDPAGFRLVRGRPPSAPLNAVVRRRTRAIAAAITQPPPLTSRTIEMSFVWLARLPTTQRLVIRCREVEMKPPAQTAAATAEVDVWASA